MLKKLVKRSAHDKMLILTTAMAVLSVIGGACGLDGDMQFLCAVMLVIGIAWLIGFIYANAERWAE